MVLLKFSTHNLYIVNLTELLTFNLLREWCPIAHWSIQQAGLHASIFFTTSLAGRVNPTRTSTISLFHIAKRHPATKLSSRTKRMVTNHTPTWKWALWSIHHQKKSRDLHVQKNQTSLSTKAGSDIRLHKCRMSDSFRTQPSHLARTSSS